ncbi:aldo/keto reductase [Bifidobacterium simiarum]|uniref:Aldo/keto reductase n=1 Tax=Bifidobacterium simiarum TaxID=2045441 RepID=A0A2M9HCC7_9BIFI|nr:aldo/keto reductase [Bifidobacterium simiarum]MBT1166574.1 aldo/keto reductase [Bifidobacterium simiarum]PJM74470.1 aldo/keto reductase [Bifidobacterium simiarum]
METRKLGNTGLEVPILSVGGAPLGGEYGEVNQDLVNETIQVAFENGMNLIDTSPWYGRTQSEKNIGVGLKGIDRSSYIITTKCGRYEPGKWDFSTERIKRSIPESMERLGLDYIDVVECHDIEWGDIHQVIDEALPVLRDYKEQGMIGFIGVTGYDLDLLEKVAVEEKLDTMMTYCNYDLQNRSLLPVAKRLAEKGIGVFSDSPLSMGALTAKGAPDWHPADPAFLQRAQEVAQLCRDAGTTIERVAMEFSVNNPADSGISTTVVGCSKPQNVLRNVAEIGIQPDPELLKQIEEMFADWLNVSWEGLKPPKADED